MRRLPHSTQTHVPSVFLTTRQLPADVSAPFLYQEGSPLWVSQGGGDRTIIVFEIESRVLNEENVKSSRVLEEKKGEEKKEEK